MSKKHPSNSLRIFKFQAENVKRLGVVQIDPKGNIIKISGKNGSGKTSVLDCIEYCLCGVSKVPSKVIRNGERSATIQLDLGEVVVTRRFYLGGRTTLQVMSKADRSIFPSPQALLDALMAKVTFDPLEFIRMTSQEQVKILRKLLNVDLEAFDADYQRDYDLRRDVKKEYESVEVRRDAVMVQADLPLERRDEEALTQELAEASTFNAAIEADRLERENAVAVRDNYAKHIDTLGEEIAELESQLRATKERLATTKANHKKQEQAIAAWKPLAEPKNILDLRNAVNAARVVNAAIAKREQRDVLQAEVDALKARHKALDESVKANRAARSAAIAEAEFPIKGLGFGEDEVLWQGLPFNQVSNADQIRASVAIGMAMNPRLRVMRVKDGSLLDSTSMSIVAQLASTEDFQLWMEVVDETGKVGIFLEDGEVKTVNDESEVPAEPERDMRIDLPMPGAMTVDELDPPAKGKRGRPRKEK